MSDVSRRNFLRGAAASGVAVGAVGLLGPKAWAATPTLWSKSGPSDGVPGDQIHLQYGADAGTQMTVSWHTANRVSRPSVRLGTPHGGFGRQIGADSVSYVDGINGVETIFHHARITGLHPDTTYVYEVLADGAPPVQGTFRTAPVGRVPFRFTSVGDMATPNVAWSKSSLNAAVTVAQLQQFNPVFHLHNGDLSYANVNWPSQPQVWADFMNNIQPVAAHIPWMTALGNHESEWGNGPLGYASYQTRFALPDNGSRNSAWSGNWYSFQVGSVFVVSLDANDVHYANDGSSNGTATTTYDPSFRSPFVTTAPAADGGSSLYIHGYSEGAQKLWLERTLRRASTDDSVDWIVAVFHQPIISSSSAGAGGDLGIREGFLDAFDRYGVDLVLVGHDHDYERSYVVRGTDRGTQLRPTVVNQELHSIDLDAYPGTVHMVIGGGGTSSHDDVYGADTVGTNPIYGGDPVAQLYLGSAADTVYKAVGAGSEIATWSAVRDPDPIHPWGLATFDVDPGSRPGGQTSITVSFWHTAQSVLSSSGSIVTPYGSLTNPDSSVFDTFTLSKRRKDARRILGHGQERVGAARSS